MQHLHVTALRPALGAAVLLDPIHVRNLHAKTYPNETKIDNVTTLTCGFVDSLFARNAASSSSRIAPRIISFSTAVLFIHSINPSRGVIGTTSYVLQFKPHHIESDIEVRE